MRGFDSGKPMLCGHKADAKGGKGLKNAVVQIAAEREPCFGKGSIAPGEQEKMPFQEEFQPLLNT